MDGEEEARFVAILDRIIGADPDNAQIRAQLQHTTWSDPGLLVAAIREQAEVLGIDDASFTWIAASNGRYGIFQDRYHHYGQVDRGAVGPRAAPGGLGAFIRRECVFPLSLGVLPQRCFFLLFFPCRIHLRGKCARECLLRAWEKEENDPSLSLAGAVQGR